MMPSSSACSTSASMPSSVRCSSVCSNSCSEMRARDSAPSRKIRAGTLTRWRREPAAPEGGANVQWCDRAAMFRNEVHQDDHFQREEDPEFQKRFPGSRNEIDDAARGFQNQEGEPEMPEDAESAPAAAAIDLSFGSISASKISRCSCTRPVVMRPNSR